MSGFSYRLCGFASGVDWRPIKFKARLPPARICGLCGFVPDKIAVLPCSHLSCESCLQGCGDGDKYVCPIDKVPFLADEDVCWITPPPHHLSQLRVFCWNVGHGCNFDGTVGNLLEHFEMECGFHATSCLYCENTVLRKGLLQHYKTGCAAQASPPAATADVGVVSPEGDSTLAGRKTESSFQVLASIQERSNELLEMMEHMSRRLLDSELLRGAGSLEKQMRGVSQSLNTLLEGTQEATASLRIASDVAAYLPSGKNVKVITNDPEDKHVVLTLGFYPFLRNWNYKKDWRGATFTLETAGEMTNIEFKCTLSPDTNSVAVCAKVKQPGKWSLPTVESLPFLDISSPSLVSWVHWNVSVVCCEENFSTSDYTLCCMSKLPSKVEDNVKREKCSANFLIKMKPDIRK